MIWTNQMQIIQKQSGIAPVMQYTVLQTYGSGGQKSVQEIVLERRCRWAITMEYSHGIWQWNTSME